MLDADLEFLLDAQEKQGCRVFMPYEQQQVFFDLGARYKTRTLSGANRVGKALKHGTCVLTPSGPVPIERLSVGDLVFAGDGKPTKVTGVYPQGELDLFKINFDGSHDIFSCGEHLWECQEPKARYPYRYKGGKKLENKNYGVWGVCSTSEMLKHVGEKPCSRMRYVVPTAKPLYHPHSKLPLNPYLLGVLLGDGYFGKDGVKLTAGDREIVHFVQGYLPNNVQIAHVASYDYILRKVGGYRNPLIQILKAMGLIGCKSAKKFVPEDYLKACVSHRYALLQGLMDTDGSINKNGAMEFSSCSPFLARAVEYLVVSLGGRCTIETRQTKYTDANGVKKNGQMSFRVRIRINLNPFRISKKAARWNARHNTDNRIIHSITPAGRGEATCISVASPCKTFVIEGGIVTHNTSAFYRGELPFHLTGEYPEWWQGRRFNGPIRALVGSPDWKTNIKGCQLALMGDVLLGRQGMCEIDEMSNSLLPCGIPHDCIERLDPLGQVKGALNGAQIKHKSGGSSYVSFYAYSQGREALQAAKVQIVGMDEEPPMDVYTELATRTMDSGGMRVLTFTPLKGLSEVVKQQIGNVTVDEKFPSVIRNDFGALVRISMHDAPHLTPAMIKEYKGTVPKHEHMARVEGIPALGEGAIYTTPDENLLYPWSYGHDGRSVPDDWEVCDGLDIGINHPTARARVYRDLNTDTYYLTQVYKENSQTTKIHAMNWKHDFKGNVPVVWPGDARNRQEALDGDALESVADKYIRHGVKLTADPVQMRDGARLSAEGAIQELDELMRTGKFKVADGGPGVDLFFAEKRLYRREKMASGRLRIVGEFDDALHATRNAVLGLQAGQGHRVRGAFSRYPKTIADVDDARMKGKPLSAITVEDDGDDYTWTPGT